MLVTLAEAKAHLRVDSDDEDALIGGLIDAATAAVANDLNMPPADLAVAVPAPVRAAALLLVGDMYEHREAQTDRPLTRNATYANLLAPYRVYE